MSWPEAAASIASSVAAILALIAVIVVTRGSDR